MSGLWVSFLKSYSASSGYSSSIHLHHATKIIIILSISETVNTTVPSLKCFQLVLLYLKRHHNLHNHEQCSWLKWSLTHSPDLQSLHLCQSCPGSHRYLKAQRTYLQVHPTVRRYSKYWVDHTIIMYVPAMIPPHPSWHQTMLRKKTINAAI